jgi:hypothetical protein
LQGRGNAFTGGHFAVAKSGGPDLRANEPLKVFF